MLSPSNLPLESIKDDLVKYIRYLHEKTNCIVTLDAPYGVKSDRFSIKYPYANIFIKIEICYNPINLKLPPDIYFLEHDDFMAELSQIKALQNWDPNDAKCLHSILNDLVNIQFKYHNEKKLINFSKKSVVNEYIQLKEAYSDENLQIYVNKGLDFVSINLFINLNQIVFTDQQSSNTEMMTGKTYYVSINYVHYRDKQQLNLNHEFSNDFKDYIHKKLNSKVDSIMRMPEYDENYDNMKSHSERVCEAVINFMKYSKQNFLRRRTYIQEFKEIFKSSLVEYDAKYFSCAAALISHEDFFCLLKVKLNDKFPNEAPLLTFYSIYHVNSIRLPYKQIVDEYDYNKMWNSHDMVKSLKDGLLVMVKRFKESSIKEGKLNI